MFGARETVAPKPKEEIAVLELFEENIEAVRVFTDMVTQWIVGGMGSVVGLDYRSLEVVMRFLEVTNVKDCFSRVRIMEGRALERIKESQQNGSTT